MNTRPLRAARPRLLALLLLAPWLLAPATARAHARLTRSEPAARARLAAAPREIVLWFSLAPEPAFTRVTLLRDGLVPVPVAAAARVPGDPLAVRLTILGALAPGSYTVTWQSAVADGHPLRGRYTFAVAGPPAGAAPPPAGAADAAGDAADPHAGHDGHAGHGAPAEVARPAGPPALHADQEEHAPAAAHAVSAAGVALRAATFGALLAIVGAVVFQRLVLRAAAPALLNDYAVATRAASHAAGVGAAASLLLLVAAGGRLVEQAVALPAAGGALAGTVDVLVGTRWGLGWVLQVGAGILALLGFARARSARGERAAWTLAAVAAAALCFTPALSGHAAAAGRLAPLAIASDGFHVIGAGGWIGTLLVLAVAGLPAAGLALERRGAAVAALVNAFSPLALVFAALAALTGATSTLLHVTAPEALWTTPWGRALLLKLALVLVVLGVGAWNWRRVRPRLPAADAALRLEKSSLVELAAALLVVLATALLTGTSPSD